MAGGAIILLDANEIDRLVASIKEYGDGAEDAINSVLHDYGAKQIGEEAKKLIHPSGRTWKGKAKSATVADPFMAQKDNLSVTVKSKSAYNYLYFPDDGSNTRKHAGGQHFMRKGAEAATPAIIERCLAKLTENF